MLEDLKGPPANPSSVHSFGQRAKALLTRSRQTVSSYFGVKPEEVIFTSGATESNNLMLRGFSSTKGHLITTALEHSSIYNTVKLLEAQGWTVDYIPCGLWGAPRPELIEQAIRPHTRALIFSAVNSETGVKIDLEAIASIAEKHQIPLFIDAVALIGKESLPTGKLPKGVTALSLSGHKFHAPKGIGALILRSTCKIHPQLTGGSQEFQKRGGTENLSGILGLAEAIAILAEKDQQIEKELLELRMYLEEEICKKIPTTLINGQGPRVSNTVCMAFPGIDGESLLMHLDLAGIAVSHGSACASGALEPSRVLTQMGIDRKIARSSIRISLSRLNTKEEINQFVKIIHYICNNNSF